MENRNYQELIVGKFPNKVVPNEEKNKEVYVDADAFLDVMGSLHEEGFSFLADISSADYKEYFEVVYQLFSFSGSEHLTVKVKLDYAKPQVASVAGIWETADWLEREVYDLMGIEFLNHPNLERILTWEGFEGHPLRKDFESKSGRK